MQVKYVKTLFLLGGQIQFNTHFPVIFLFIIKNVYLLTLNPYSSSLDLVKLLFYLLLFNRIIPLILIDHK